MNNSGWVWCGFHNTIVCRLSSISNRIQMIKDTKPLNEILVRLANLKPIKGNLPEDVIKARDTYDKARNVYNKAIKSNISAIRALYEKEVPEGNWNWNTMQLNFKK